MPNKVPITSMHTLLHAAEPAMCCTAWSEMAGDDLMRTCNQCGTVALNAARMEPEVFCSEADKLKPKYGPLQAYRRSDGTYTFSDKTCSPKGMFAPQNTDLRGVMIANWWFARYGRYNKYLFFYGLAVGGLATLICLLMGSGWVAIAYFVVCATLCAIAANIAFVIMFTGNLIVPQFLAPVRKSAGPILLATSMAVIGFIMTVPLIIFLVSSSALYHQGFH